MITIGSVSVDLEGILTAAATLATALAAFVAAWRGRRAQATPPSSTDNQDESK
jgi:hypothetical protein